MNTDETLNNAIANIAVAYSIVEEKYIADLEMSLKKFYADGNSGLGSAGL